MVPPLGLGLITSYLRSKGISIEQDDLNIKLNYDNCYSSSSGDKIDTEVFFDTPRIEKYIKRDKDSYIDSIMERVSSKIKIHEEGIILLSLPDNIENCSNLGFASAFLKFIKKRYNSITIMGGQGPWLDLLRTGYNPEDIDFTIKGDGEYPIYNLLNSISDNKKLSDAPDLSIGEKGRVILSNKISETIKPDFSGLPIEKYKSREEVLDYPREIEGIMERFQKSGALLLPYRFIRGCPFECIFCISAVQNLNSVLSPEEIVQHLKSLQEEYHPTGFFFLNDTINISEGYVSGLCDEIISNRLKILWSDCARIDNLNRDMLFKMREAGCIRLIFGMETASPRLLKYINKRIDLKKLESVLRWSDEAGIWTGVEVICGFPHEKKEDIESTISFLNKNKRYINRIYLNHFDLRQNTPLYNFPQRYGLERIFEINQYTQKDFSGFFQFGFDENNGLHWEEKEKQIEYSVKMIQENCVGDSRFFTDEHLLFFLYSNFDDKETINDIYLKILNQGSE